MTKQNKSNQIAYWGWLAISIFYCYQYILRVAPAVLVTPLREDFGLKAEDFSTLGSFYLYAYALAQIPMGILVDRHGVRRVMMWAMACCLMGGFLFAWAPNFFLLQISRLLMGLGSAPAFMCALKAVMEDCPPGKRGLLMGATLTLGTVGALLAGKPVVLLSEAWGWRHSLLSIALFGILIWLLAWTMIPNKVTGKPTASPSEAFASDHKMTSTVWSTLSLIVQSRPLIIYAILAVALYTPLSVMADLWGVAFVMQKYQLSRVDAAQITMVMYVGLGLGCLTLPMLAEKYQALNRSICWSAVFLSGLFAWVIYGPVLPVWGLAVSFLFLGLVCGSEMLCFSGAAEYAAVQHVGTTLGVVNTLNMLGGGILQHVTGWALDHFWSGLLNQAGLRIYSTADYTQALSVLMGVIILCGSLVFLLPRDRFKRPVTGSQKDG